jgi:hypothetical protein
MAKNIVQMFASVVRMSVRVCDYPADGFLPIRDDDKNPSVRQRVRTDEDMRCTDAGLGRAGEVRVYKRDLSPFFLTSN